MSRIHRCHSYTQILDPKSTINTHPGSGGRESTKLSHTSDFQATRKVPLSIRLLGKIPEYTEENLYLFCGISKKKIYFTEVFFSLFPMEKKKKIKGDKRQCNLRISSLKFFVKGLLVKVLMP